MELRHPYGMVSQLLLILLCVLLTMRLAATFTFTPEDAKVILKKHNEYRRMERASDMYLLHWNISLQERADNWAHRCLFRHERNLDLGENLSFDTDRENQVLLRGMQAWHDEKSKWGYSNQMCKGTCHFSQIVWAYTTTIGCSANVCPSLEVGGRIIKDAMYLVCYYYPRGNLMGQFPYSNGRPCSKCADQDTCSEDLCVSSGPESKLAPDFVKALQPLSPVRLLRPLKAKDAFLALLQRNGQKTSGRSASQQPTQRQDTHYQLQYRNHHHQYQRHKHQGFTNTTLSISKSVSYSRENHRNAQQPPQHIVRQSHHQLLQSVTPAQNEELPKQDRQHYRHHQQRQPHQTQRNQPQRQNPYDRRGTVHAQPISIPTGMDRSPAPGRQSIPSPSMGGDSYSRSLPRPPDKRGQVQITQGRELSRDHKTIHEDGRTLHLEPAAGTLLRPQYHRPTPGTVLISDRSKVIIRDSKSPFPSSSGRDAYRNSNDRSVAVPQRNRVQWDNVRRRQHSSHIDSRAENRSGTGAVSPSQSQPFPVEASRTTSYVISSSRNEKATVTPLDKNNMAASPWRRTYTLPSRARGRTSAPPHLHSHHQRWGTGRVHAAPATTAAPVATIVKVLTREEIAARNKAREDQRRRAYVMRQRYIHRSGTSRVDQKKHAPTDSRSRDTENLSPSEIRKKYGRPSRPNLKQDNAQTTPTSNWGVSPNTPYSSNFGRTEATTSASRRPTETHEDRIKQSKNNDQRRNTARTGGSDRKKKLKRPTGHGAKKTATSTITGRQRSEKKEKLHPHKKNYVMGRDRRRCVDRHPECPRWLAKCHKSAAVTISCPLSCGKCGKHALSGAPLGYSRVKTSYHLDRRRRNPPGYHRSQRSQRKRKRQEMRRMKRRRRLFLKKQMREENSSRQPRSRRTHEGSRGQRLSRRKRKRPSSTQNRPGFCRDDPKHLRSCKYWANLGYCSENRLINAVYCRLSCATCG